MDGFRPVALDAGAKSVLGLSSRESGLNRAAEQFPSRRKTKPNQVVMQPLAAEIRQAMVADKR